MIRLQGQAMLPLFNTSVREGPSRETRRRNFARIGQRIHGGPARGVFEREDE